MKRISISKLQRIVFTISTILMLGVQCATLVPGDTDYNLKGSLNYEFYFSATSDYFVASIYTQPNQLLPSLVSVNQDTSSCGAIGFPNSFKTCFQQSSILSSFTALTKGINYYVVVSTKGDSSQTGKVSIFLQTLQDIELNNSIVLNYQKHRLMYFRIKITGSNKIFKLASPFINQITDVTIQTQSCNDYSTGKSYTGSNFALDVFKDCEVIFSLSNQSFNNEFQFTPILIDKPFLSLQNSFVPLVPQGLPNSVTNTPFYFRFDLNNLKSVIGFSAPMQLQLQLKGVNQNEKFTVNMSPTVSLPAYNPKEAICSSENVCNIPLDISEGNSFFRYFTITFNVYIEGLEYILSAHPVSFPPQGFQPVFFKANRYFEFDYNGSNYKGIGVQYIEVIGRTSGDTISIAENFDGTSFQYSYTTYSDNQYNYITNYITSPTKVQEGLRINKYTEGFEFYYTFYPLLTFTSTTKNIQVPLTWRSKTLTQQSYSAQLASYSNVQSASVSIQLNGLSSADSWSLFVSDSSCRINIFPQSQECKSKLNDSSIEGTYTIQENKPVYFKVQQNAFYKGYIFNVIFNVTCVPGYSFNGSACLPLQMY